ncbi:Hypothetical predicted protein [Podarcis lilfordi]|uniref:Uncharacterized protein n=1 Tax=Podarcis lilfordi TaxID=74358 RepID=A0AA35KZJ0_9SAUR|nr:Hypothetical predicted protein [Podarcis lilfordi]
MDARGSSLGGWGLGDLRRLQPGLFRTAADRAQLQTAVHQVFGSHAWHGCCSDKLLEALLEAGQQCYLKQQARPGKTSSGAGDPASPGETSRPPHLLVDRPRTELRRSCFSEQGASGRASSPLYRWGIRRWDEQPLERWDSGGLSTLLAEEASGVLAALERKYRVLQRKLCAEMLQAHYGHPVWTSLSQAAKEDKISELETLVDFGLREGSILPLSSLPGAQHEVRSGAPKAGDTNGGPLDPSATEGTAAHALLQLRRRRQAETAALLTHRHLQGGSNPETSRQLLHLHAQTELVHQEASFPAALLAIELFLGERFWDSQPIEPGARHLELARLRLAAGSGPASAWQEAKPAPGRLMAQVLLDRLLLQQQRDRSCLIQILLALAEPEGAQERGRGRKQPTSLGAERSREDPSPALCEAIARMLKQPGRASGAEGTWQDGAVAVLVDLQREQQEELSRTLESLSGIPSDREGAACPALFEKLLARLQESPLTSLVRDLQPASPQEQQRSLRQRGTLQTERELRLTQEPSPSEGEALTADEIPEREGEPLRRKPETSQHEKQKGFQDSEAPQGSVAPGGNRNLPQDKEIQAEQGLLLQELSPDTLETQVALLRKSKSLGSLEFLLSQDSLPHGLWDVEIPQQTPHGGLEMAHLPGAQGREMEAVDAQTHGDLQYIPQRETEALQENETRETSDLEPQREPLASGKPVVAHSERSQIAFHTQGTQFPEPPEWRESEATPSWDVLQTHKDVHKESLDPDARHVKIPCQQDLRFPELSQLQRFLRKKSKSLEPQLLSRARPWGSPQIQQEVCGPQKCGYPQALQPQEWEVEGTSQAEKEGLRSHDLRAGPQRQKFPESRDALVQVPEPLSLESEEMAKLQGVRQLEGLHIPGGPQGRSHGCLQQEQELTQAEEKTEGLETPQGQQGPELSHPETPPHCRNLWRKSKSLELRRSWAFQPQELREPHVAGTQPLHPQMGAGAVQAQDCQEPEDFEAKKAKKEQQSHQEFPQEAFQEQGMVQKGVRVTRPQNVNEAQDFSSEGAKGVILPQRQTQVPQSPERRSPESPPLLWRIMWQKAKSFEMRKKDVFLSSRPRPEAPKPSILYRQKMKETLVGQSDVLTQGQRQEMSQEMRERETRLVEKSPQRSQQILQSEEISKRELGWPRHSGESQPCDTKSLEDSQTPETVPQKEMWGPQPQRDQKPESPPLLWGALELKSKSFEMRKSEEHKLKKSLMVLSQRRPPVGPETHRPQGWNAPDTCTLQELREDQASQAQPENGALPAQRAPPERLCGPVLRERETFPGQETRELEAHQDQGTLLKKTTASESQEAQQQQRELEPSEDPGTVSQRSGAPQAPQPDKKKFPEMSRAQRMPEMVLQPEEHRSLESPPLLWRILGLKAKSFELRRPRPFQTQIQREKDASYGQQGQITSQSPQILKEPRRSQATQTDIGNDGTQPQSGPEGNPRVPQHQKRSSPETPPLLWWALELAQQETQHLSVSPQPQETEMSPAAQLQRVLQPEAQKLKKRAHQNIVYPQEPKEPETSQVLEKEKKAPKSPQPQETLPEVDSKLPASQGLGSQGLRRAEATQTPRKTPQARDVLKETRAVPVQKSPLTAKGPQDVKRSPKTQEKRGSSLPQGKGPKMCGSYKVGCCHVHPCQELQGCDTKDCGPSGEAQFHSRKELRLERAEALGRIEDNGCSALEGHNRTECLLPPGRLLGKSKSLDPRDLQTQKPQKLREQESLRVQRQPETTAFRVQEDLQMKPKSETQTFESQEERSLEASEAQSTSRSSQPQGPGAESPSHLQSRLERASESRELMGPPESSPHRDPENLKLQGTVDPKGHCESQCCGVKMDDLHSEVEGTLGRSSQTFHVQETFQLQAALLRKSKSLEPQELSRSHTFGCQASKELETPQSLRYAEGCPQVPENQALENITSCETTQAMKNLLQDTSVAKNEDGSSVQKMLRDKEVSHLQKLGQKDLGATNETQEDNQQLQGQKENEDLQPPGAPQTEQNPLEIQGLLQRDLEGIGPPDARQLCLLQLEESLMEDETSQAELPLSHMETKDLPPWLGLGKSKSLDPRELQGKELGDPTNLQNMGISKSCHPQRQGELEPQDLRGAAVLHSGTLQELPPNHIQGPQFQPELECGTQKTGQVEKEPPQVQGSLRNRGGVLSSQELKGAQIFHSKECEELEELPLQKSSQSETLQIQGFVQREAEPQELVEPQSLDPQEKREVQSPPLLRNLPRKSKTLGHWTPTRGDGLVHRPESPRDQPVKEPLQGLVGQKSQNTQGQSQLDQRTLDIAEGTPGSLDSHREGYRMEAESIKSPRSLPVSQDFLQEQRDEMIVAQPVSLPQSLPPHKAPQVDLEQLPELEGFYHELEALQPQGLRTGEAQQPQENRDFGEPEKQAATEPQGTMGLEIPQEWRGSESHQPPTTDQEATETRETRQGQQMIPQPPPSQKGVEGPCQPPGRRVRSPKLKAPQKIPGQECSPEASAEVPGVSEPHVFQSQESMEPQAEWGSLKAEGSMAQLEPAPTEPHEQPRLELWGVLLGRSKSLDPQELTRTQDLEDTRGMRRAGEDPCSQDSEMPSPREPPTYQPQQALQPHSNFPNRQGTPEEVRDPNTLFCQNLREPKVHGMGDHFQAEDGVERHLPEGAKLCRVCRQQELQGEVGALDSQGTEGPRAFQSQEQRLKEALPAEGPQPRMLSAPGMHHSDQGDLEPGALSRRLEASPLWEQAPIGTWKPTAMAMLSPPSPGERDEEPVWTPAALAVGLSRESSICIAQPERRSGVSWDGEVDMSSTVSMISPFWEEPTAYSEADSGSRAMAGSSRSAAAEEAGGHQPPRPRPPCREKAFVWLSRQEKEAALRRLAELQAEGERRHQRDKERQTLRFQERLSIAKHRKSEDDLLGSSPAEFWPLPSENEGQQDQAGQKTAVKRHLEKVKRERTYVMQSKRERNTLRFKELLNPLVAEGEEIPEQEQTGDS